MVTFTKESFIIEVKTGITPHEHYIETANDIINVMQGKDPDFEHSTYYLLELLRQMLPNEEQARAMYNEIKDL